MAKLVKAWVGKIGNKQALRRLVIQGVSPVTSDKIVHGRYPSNPRDLLAKVLLKEAAKDGIYPVEGEAS